MTTFDDRENAYEAKFAHDEALMFRAMARRDKLLGLWAADLLGLSGDEAAKYAKDVVIADMEEAGDEDIIRKVVADLGARSTEAAVRARLAECLTEAKRQINAET